MNTNIKGNNPFTIFDYKNLGSVRISIDQSGNPWFCLVDVLSILGIGNVTDVRNRLNPDGFDSIEVGVQTGVRKDGSPSIQNVNMIFVDEGNLYEAIGRSRKPEAKVFMNWVYREVLPSIRKNGYYYKKPMTEMEMIHTISGTLINVENRLNSIEDKLETQRRTNYYTKRDLINHEDELDEIDNRLSTLEDILL